MDLAGAIRNTRPLSISNDKLPAELLFIIFELSWNREWQARHDLIAWSRVCSTWRPIAQSLLFMEVILIYNLRARAFLAAVRGNPSLGRATKILDISDDILSTEPNLAYKITAKCPNLYRLTHCIPPHIGQKSLQSLLYPRTFTTLQALVLQLEPPPEKYASETSLMHFLRQFSSLSHLILENVHLLGKRPLNPFLFTYSPPSPPFELPPPPPSFKLKEFGWITGSHYQGSLGTFKSIVTWLFQEPSNGPLYFHTNVEDPRGHSKILVWFIENYGRNLISISASVEREGPPSAAIDLSVACPNLCELILPWAEIFPQQFQTLIPLNRLKHLELSAGMPWSRYSVTDMITVIDWIMSLPELQLVTLNFYKPKANPNDALVRLWKERCAPSVKIVIHDYLALKLITRDDMVLMSRFPRGKTVENLRRMVTPRSRSRHR